jgi:hypothetical protein
VKSTTATANGAHSMDGKGEVVTNETMVTAKAARSDYREGEVALRWVGWPSMGPVVGQK